MIFSSTESNILGQIGIREWALQVLTLREFAILLLLLSGENVVDIAASQRVSRRYATRVIKSLRLKFDRFFSSQLTG